MVKKTKAVFFHVSNIVKLKISLLSVQMSHCIFGVVAIFINDKCEIRRIRRYPNFIQGAVFRKSVFDVAFRYSSIYDEKIVTNFPIWSKNIQLTNFADMNTNSFGRRTTSRSASTSRSFAGPFLFSRRSTTRTGSGFTRRSW